LSETARVHGSIKEVQISVARRGVGCAPYASPGAGWAVPAVNPVEAEGTVTVVGVVEIELVANISPAEYKLVLAFDPGEVVGDREGSVVIDDGFRVRSAADTEAVVLARCTGGELQTDWLILEDSNSKRGGIDIC
jgi:hypothetical protein